MTSATLPNAPRAYRVFPSAPDAVNCLCEELSVSPVLAQILVNRGLADSEAAEAFLLGGHESLHDGTLLDGLSDAVELVSQAVQRGQRILIHGDYDADGVSGTALLVAFLKDIGGHAVPYIPHRIDEGYGLSAEGVRQAAEEGFQLMVSVDCGSSSPQVVELARSLGMKVVITDHHMVTTVPPADAFVNPRAPDSTYPFPHLSGAGVAYKLIQVLSRRLGCGDPQAYLDLAAIGTVGDVVPLIGENRILVREGLAVMERMERPGIAALARVAGIGKSGDAGAGQRRPLTARDIAFDIAPRINACGRLEHALQAALLLLEEDETRADALAGEVDALNQQRRALESRVREQAEERVQARGLESAHAIVEASEDWHQGIVGITANRLLDKYGLPSFIINLMADGTAKGSARAPAHIDLYACLTRCADLFTHFGGHPRAGGFSMPAANIDALRDRLQVIVPELSAPPEPPLRVDLLLPLEGATLSLAEELECLAPFGQANPLPLFLARGVRLRFAEVLKERHWRFQAMQSEAAARCIAFNLVERIPRLSDRETYDMIYELQSDTYRGEARLNFVVRELVPRGTAAAKREQPTAPPERYPTPFGTSTWDIVNAAGTENRGRYLADVVAEGNATYVLCRRDQVEFINRVVAAGASQAPPNLRTIAYGAAIDAPAGAAWILFTPPPSLDTLRPMRDVGGGRCHVLFGMAAMEEEAALVAALTMDRDRLQRIYRMFKAGSDARGTFDDAQFSDMIALHREYTLRVESLRVGARIFKDIGVIEESKRHKRRYRFTGARADLEGSSTYQRYARLSDDFRQVHDLFCRDEARAGERLLAALSRA